MRRGLFFLVRFDERARTSCGWFHDADQVTDRVSVGGENQGSRLALRCLKCTDFGTEFLHGSWVWLALTGGGIVARALVEETQESDGIHRAEVIGKDGDSLAVEVYGSSVGGQETEVNLIAASVAGLIDD